MDGQALFDKLEQIEDAITNHVMGEIKHNTQLINGLMNELMLIRGSLQANTEGFRVLNDRVHRLVEQLSKLEIDD